MIPLEGGINPVAEAAVGTGEGMDAVHLLRGEFEIEDVKILGGPTFLRRARNGDDVLLDQPAQGDLAGRLAVGAADLVQRRLVADLALGQRRPGRDRRAEILRSLQQLRQLEIRMVLDLVGDELRARQGLGLAEFGGREVGQADGPGQAAISGLVQCAEGLLKSGFRLRPVQQQQVGGEAEVGG